MNSGRLTRRAFLTTASAMAITARSAELYPQIAFTFDDPKLAQSGNMPWQQINERMLAALARRRIKAALFVCGMRVDQPSGRDLIHAWDDAGHLIGNHSYSHLNFDMVSLSAFEGDALRNEPLVRPYQHFTPLFRYPFFKEGNTAEKRDGMRAFLADRGYRLGRATVDSSDWAISARLEKRIQADPSADVSAYRSFFLQHIWDRAQYYDFLAQRVLGRSVRHTVLLHHNALNALFLGDLIAMFIARRWNPIDADVAYQDPVYARQPHVLPAGESLIWSLAKESGRFDAQLRYPGEDEVYENPRMDALKL